MQTLTRRPALRWLAPLALVVAVGGTSLVAVTADADPALPPKTPEQLLVDVANAEVDGLSGTVTQTAELGLPALPVSGGGRSGDLTSLLSGSHTLRVWYAGHNQARVALLSDLGETDVIRNGDDVWTWKSADNEATHTTLPERTAPAGAPTPDDLPSTPQEAADTVLAAVGPTTTVSTDRSVSVAGRDAYELVLTPKDTRSLVGRVALAVDAQTSVPLRVQVVNTSGVTVFEVAFTTVDFAVPDAEQFEFNPPPGAEVSEKAVPKRTAPSGKDLDKAKDKARDKAEQAREDTEVVGTGWTTVVVSKADLDTEGSDAAALRGVLEQLPKVSGSWGSGRLLAGTAFTAVLTDDGRLAVGAVAPELVYEALAK